MTWNFTGAVAGKRVTPSSEGVFLFREVQSQLASRDEAFRQKLGSYDVTLMVFGPDDARGFNWIDGFGFDVLNEGGAHIETGFGEVLRVTILPGKLNFHAFAKELDSCIGSEQRLASFTLDVPPFISAENEDEGALQAKGSFVSGEQAIFVPVPVFHVVGRTAP